MKHLNFFFLFCASLFLIFGCADNRSNDVAKIVKEWQDKEIVFPANPIFTLYAKDTVNYAIPSSPYKILMYVDSVGCTSCKLQLHKWKEFIAEVDSLTNGTVPVLFFFHPNDKREISYLLRRDGIDIPVCMDEANEINTLNHFPSRQEFQTFLLNQDNRVSYIGNPIYNARVKELYLSEISNSAYQDTSVQSSRNTQISIDKTVFDLGTIPKGDAKTVSVSIKNTGNSPFIIFDTRASCGCTHIAYDKKPIAPDSATFVEITYHADDRGHFNKTVSLYGNMEHSPFVIRLKGNIE